MFPLIIFVCVLMCVMYAISRMADKQTVSNPSVIMRPFASVEQYMLIRQRIPIEESVRPLARFVPQAASEYGINSPTKITEYGSAPTATRSSPNAVKTVKAHKPVDVLKTAKLTLAKASDFGVKPQKQFIYSPSGVLNLARAKDFGL